jgi:hypothetical protein
MNQFWYVSSKPWKDCPFSIQLVVFTKNGEEDAKKIFREFYQNPKLEIEECSVVICVKGELEEEEKEKDARSANA